MDIYNKLLDKFSIIKDEAYKRINAKKKQSAEQQLSNTEDPSRFYSLPPADNNTNDQDLNVKGFGSNFATNFSEAFPSSDSFGNESSGIVSSNSISALSLKDSNDKLNNATSNNQLSSIKSNVTVRYRALFEFVARSEDELSLQPGDIILVFEEHASEPGWLAGQIKEKVGWFPAAFAEKIQENTGADCAKKVCKIQCFVYFIFLFKSVSTLSSIATSPSTEPLESIKEETMNEKELKIVTF